MLRSALFVFVFFSCSHICFGCIPGTYLNNGTCGYCNKGFYCPDSNMTSPFPCPLGKFADQIGATNCTICPLGFYCNETDRAPVKCPLGYYSTLGMSICLPCSAGHRWGFFVILLVSLCLYVLR